MIKRIAVKIKKKNYSKDDLSDEDYSNEDFSDDEKDEVINVPIKDTLYVSSKEFDIDKVIIECKSMVQCKNKDNPDGNSYYYFDPNKQECKGFFPFKYSFKYQYNELMTDYLCIFLDRKTLEKNDFRFYERYGQISLRIEDPDDIMEICKQLRNKLSDFIRGDIEKYFPLGLAGNSRANAIMRNINEFNNNKVKTTVLRDYAPDDVDEDLEDEEQFGRFRQTKTMNLNFFDHIKYGRTKILLHKKQNKTFPHIKYIGISHNNRPVTFPRQHAFDISDKDSTTCDITSIEEYSEYLNSNKFNNPGRGRVYLGNILINFKANMYVNDFAQMSFKPYVKSMTFHPNRGAHYQEINREPKTIMMSNVLSI